MSYFYSLTVFKFQNGENKLNNQKENKTNLSDKNILQLLLLLFH